MTGYSSFKQLLAWVCGIAGAATSTPGTAANWLLLQGTESPSQPAGIRFTGFLQADYQRDLSSPSPTGTYTTPKLIGPDLDTQSTFTMRRIRLGARGKFEQKTRLNYLFFAEFGNNGITSPGDHPRVVDATITLALNDHHWLRTGLLKTPGAEEGLQAINVADYVNPSTVTNQLVTEWIPNQHFTSDLAPLDLNNIDHSLNGFDEPVSAYRDTGIELFGVQKPGKWEYSYALMVGNGNGLSFSDNDHNKDIYLYLATEKVTAGQGGRRQGLKLFLWRQHGQREFDGDIDGLLETYDRRRSGLGVTWREKPWRVTSEYINGSGMIFLGPDKPSFDHNGPTQTGGSGLTGHSEGAYIEGGWYIAETPWELDLRFDRYDRLKDDLYETRFETTTLGTQYHISSDTHITLNFMRNHFRAVNFAAGVGPNVHLDGVSNRWALSIFTAF